MKNLAPLNAVFAMGQVDATSTSTAFTATIQNVDSYFNGLAVYLKNGIVTSEAGCTLDVNGLGAKPIYQSQDAASAITTQFNVNYTALFVFNESRIAGGCWDYFYGYNSDTNTTAYNIRDNQATKVMKNKLYRYQFVFTARDGTLIPSCNLSNNTGTTKNLTTDAFDPFASIYYYNSTTTISEGNSPAVDRLWFKSPTCNMRYGFNVSHSQLTEKAPVYVQCSPQGDGTVKLSGKDCIVQSLPNSADGYVYIFLGYAYSAYQIELSIYHPIYEYKNGAIRLWTNSDIPSPSSASPSANGTAAAGTSLDYARADHMHPTDTTRAAAVSVPTSASINSSGLVTFKNSNNVEVFTLQLPLIDIDTVYPVGSIYLSVSGTSPEILFGGTWEAINDKFLLASGTTYTAGTTGGEASHTLTESELPSHRHTEQIVCSVGVRGWASAGSNSGSNKYVNLQEKLTVSPNDDDDQVVKTLSTGGGEAHNNMPPYLSVYVWKRVA